MLDIKETTIGTSPIIRLYSAAQPGAIATEATPKIAEGTLPSDWQNAAASAVKTKTGTWTLTASVSAIAQSYAILNSAGTVIHETGTVGLPGSGADMIMDNTDLEPNQIVSVTTYTETGPGA